MSAMVPTLLICSHRRLGAGSCGADTDALRAALEAAVAARGLDWQVATIGCLGQCAHGPNLRAAPGGPMRHRCRAEDATALVADLAAQWPVGG